MSPPRRPNRCRLGSTGLAALWALLAMVWMYLYLAPFTKVEESFNTQATRDILKLGWRLDEYDHQLFPGVVPRTFLGALLVGLLSAPLFHICTGLLGMTDLVGLYISRATLGFLGVMSFGYLQRAVGQSYGRDVAWVFIAVSCLQFHLPFYLSRMLPNCFALMLSNVAMADWIAQPRSKRPLYILLFAMMCFRCDILLLLVPLMVYGLLMRHLTLLQILFHGALGAGLSLAMTVGMDSWFWGRWLWPEGEVFYFNAILQKSVEWGVMPWHWYWTSALPRSLLIAFPLSLLAPFLDRRLTRVTLIALIYVLLYSRMGHKEVRFLFPVLPLFNISAAVSLMHLWRNRHKTQLSSLLATGCVLGCVLSGAVTLVMLSASVWNYPGGYALQELYAQSQTPLFFQQKDCRHGEMTVHIGTLPAMTGISRFLQLDHCWHYSKTENLTVEEMTQSNFTYLVTEHSHLPGSDPVS